MLPQLPTLPRVQRRLLKLFSALPEPERESLLAFAEFLMTRTADAVCEQGALVEPKPIPRPVDESVVGAIKRLSESYFMLDRSLLLDDTSSLMTAHIVNGRTAVEIIDDLEQLFQQKHQEYLEGEQP